MAGQAGGWRGVGIVADSMGAEMIRGTQIERQGFVHFALLYHSQREYVDSVVGFVDDGLSMDEAVLVAVPGEELALLRDGLDGAGGGLPAGLQMADSAEVARNPEPVSGAGSLVRRRTPRSTGADRQPSRLARPHRG